MEKKRSIFENETQFVSTFQASSGGKPTGAPVEHPEPRMNLGPRAGSYMIAQGIEATLYAFVSLFGAILSLIMAGR